ncbi:uncharacterized protein G2W53_023940 [Senna tora]|uniref:Uncharacterized protein n=1 Tax=Senna tora TaxID=362788 RepID=A0A834TCD4_9FABA|nr:uncharacterized protein G2W53_023940 [Senna tora]
MFFRNIWFFGFLVIDLDAARNFILENPWITWEASAVTFYFILFSMEPLPVILDISSDEEIGLEEGPKSIDYEWIREILGVSDKRLDDSDEVVVVREVHQTERKSKSSKTAPAASDLDDDCVVLDGDPEKQVTSVNESVTESDELLIVGETGQVQPHVKFLLDLKLPQKLRRLKENCDGRRPLHILHMLESHYLNSTKIACRDYPHPRHLCATFPFSSTPHERHCEKCHCYVCDLPAPCLKWGTGILSTDHCHATEKAEMWKIQRKNFKVTKTATLPASTNYGNLPHVGHPQYSQALPLPLGISRLSSNPIPQNQYPWPTLVPACTSSLTSTIPYQVTRANTIPICSSITNLTVPNDINNSRCQESVSHIIRNRHQPQLISRQLLSVRNNVFQKDRRRSASSLGPHFSRRPMMSKGVSRVQGTLSANHSAHGSSGYSNLVNPTQQYDKYHGATGLSNNIDRAGNMRNNNWCPTDLSMYPHTSFAVAQPSLNCYAENYVASETQAYSQPSQLQNSQNYYLSCMQGNNASSRYSQHGTEHQIGSQIQNAGGNIIPCRNSSDTTNLLEPPEKNQGETARKEDFLVPDLIWNENASQGIEPLIENPHAKSTGSIINQPSNPKESDNLFAGSTNLSSIVDFEKWLMETDVALPSEWNIPSPNSIPVVDSGTLFCDFDSSWNGLTHA